MELYIREMLLGDTKVYLIALLGQLGTTYAHYARWNPHPCSIRMCRYLADLATPSSATTRPCLCPWDSKEALEARIAELESLVHSE